MPRLGPYSKEIVLGKVDGRTKQGRLMRQVRKALIAQLGGEEKLTPEQRLLVERGARLQLRCAMLDERMDSGKFTRYDSDVYIAASNGLRLLLRDLGLETPINASSAPSLAEYIASKRPAA